MKRFALAFASLLSFAGVDAALAQTWDGSTSGSWNVGANWVGGLAPGASANVTFDGTGINLATTFNGTSYTLNSLTFTANQTSPVMITTTNANPVTFGTTGTKLTVAAGNHTFTGTKAGNALAGDWSFGSGASTFTLEIATNASFQIDGKVVNGNANQNYVKTGGGRLILSANNGGSTPAWNFQSGSTGFSINQGAVQFAATNATGNSQNDWSVASGAAFEISNNATLNVATGDITLNGTGIGGTGAMRSLSGNNVLNPAASSSGTIILNASSSIGVDAGTLTIGKGISGAASNTLTKVGAGTLVLGRSVAINNNTYSGGTLVDGGTLRFAITGALYNGNQANWTAANLNAKSGTTLAFNVGGSDEFSTGNITTLLTNLGNSTSSTNGMNAGSSLGFDTSNASGGNFTIADTIADTGGASGGARGLTKLGTGTLILSGTNTYTGTTTITAGTLLVNGSHTGGGAYSVNAGATVGGTGSTASALDIAGTLAPGASIETFGSGAVNLLNGSTFAYEIDSSGASDAMADLQLVSGGLTLANGVGDVVNLTVSYLNDTSFAPGTTFTLFNYSGSWNGGNFTFGGDEIGDGETFTAGLTTWQLDYNAGVGGSNDFGGSFPNANFVNIVAVPEPAAIILVAASCAAALVMHRRGRSITA